MRRERLADPRWQESKPLDHRQQPAHHQVAEEHVEEQFLVCPPGAAARSAQVSWCHLGDVLREGASDALKFGVHLVTANVHGRRSAHAGIVHSDILPRLLGPEQGQPSHPRFSAPRCVRTRSGGAHDPMCCAVRPCQSGGGWHGDRYDSAYARARAGRRGTLSRTCSLPSRWRPTWAWVSPWSMCCGRGGSPRGSATSSTSTRTSGRRSTNIAALAWVGCVADTPELAKWFGDDIAFRGDSYEVELAGLPGLAFMLRHAGAGGPRLHKLPAGLHPRRHPRQGHRARVSSRTA